MPEQDLERELRQELLAAFDSEYREHLQAIRSRLDSGPVSGAALRDVFRRAHSLKGAARAVELPEIEQIAHELETLLFRSVETNEALSPDGVAVVRRGLDSIEVRMRAPSAPDDPDAADGAAARDGGPGRGQGPGVGPGLEPGSAAIDRAVRVPGAEIDRLGSAVHTLSEALAQQDRDRLVLGMAERELRRIVALCASLPAGGELEERLRAVSRHLSLQAATAAGGQVDRAMAGLRAQVERLTLVPADSVFGPLGAMARDLARENGFEVEVVLSGMAVLAERSVLQALRDPAIQLLRNAISHGAARAGTRAAGAVPRIELRIGLRAARLELVVQDNGSGPDLAAIERVARRRGLLPPDAPVPDEAGLLALVFEPGFSTAAEVDRLSGRGMGLSIVAEAAVRLGGAVSMRAVRTRTGAPAGTRLRIRVPLAARREVLLLVEENGYVFGLPAGAVRRLLRLPAAAVSRTGDGPVVRLAEAEIDGPGEAATGTGADRLLPLRALGGVLGRPEFPDPVMLALVLLSTADGVFGLVVERMREVCTLVVRPPDAIGLDRALVAGLALDTNDRPVLVLEPDALARALRRGRAATAAAPVPAVAAAPVRAEATILVVDDSITTRTLEKTILQAQGYRVLIAVDGMDALNVLRTAQWGIDVVIADVEMPRLDGFGLLAAMRADPRLAAIPTVLMTSRDDEADVRRGLDLGARAYIAKQEFDQGALLATIGQLLP